MTEAASDRQEIERRIVQRSLEDEAFRKQLLDDPRAAIGEEIGAPLPDEVQVVAVEETADTIYLVLPHSGSSAGQDPEEVSDQDLEAVAGGGVATQNTCVSGENTCSTCGGWSC
jgi:hypothetical protein